MGPGSPALRYVVVGRDLIQRRARAAVLGVDQAPDRQAVRRRWINVDRVARGDVAVADNSQVGAAAPGPFETLDKAWVAHAHPELEAGRSGLGHLEHARANSPPLTDDA